MLFFILLYSTILWKEMYAFPFFLDWFSILFYLRLSLPSADSFKHDLSPAEWLFDFSLSDFIYLKSSVDSSRQDGADKSNKII